MATLTLDIRLLKVRYAHLGEAELNRILKVIEKRFYDFGKKFPMTDLHERSRTRFAIGGGSMEELDRILELSGIPDEALTDAWESILPEMPLKALPEHDDDET